MPVKRCISYSLTLLSAHGYGMSFLPEGLSFHADEGERGAAATLTCTISDIPLHIRRQLLGGEFTHLQILPITASGGRRRLLFEGVICYVVASRTSATTSAVSFQAISDKPRRTARPPTAVAGGCVRPSVHRRCG